MGGCCENIPLGSDVLVCSSTLRAYVAASGQRAVGGTQVYQKLPLFHCAGVQQHIARLRDSVRAEGSWGYPSVSKVASISLCWCVAARSVPAQKCQGRGQLGISICLTSRLGSDAQACCSMFCAVAQIQGKGQVLRAVL